MVRSIIAVFAGVIVAGVVVALVEALGHAVYPPPTDLDFNDPDALRRYVDSLPVPAILFVLAAWVAGTLAGGLTAAFIARRRRLVVSLIVGGFMLAAAIVNLVMIPHPLWFAVLALISIPLAALAAGKLAPGKE